MVELQSKFCLLSFSLESELIVARKWSPWSVVGHKFVVTNWVPSFDPSCAFIASTSVWIQLPGLSIKLWTKEHLRQIVSLVSQFICKDDITYSQGQKG